MENVAISEIVSISPTYTSEVNIGMDFADREMNARKVEGYIPTAPARHAMSRIVQGLIPVSSKRVHLVTGMYGTGKSHFGLVLANLFGLPPGDDLLAPLMAKLSGKDPDVAELIRRNRSAIPQKFLVVILSPTAERGGFNYALLAALQNSLKDAGLEYRPKTHFSDAALILEKWTSDVELTPRLERELRDQRTDARRLLTNLRELKTDAYDQFCTIYETMMHVPFRPENFGDPLKVYAETARYLRTSAEMAGIFVVADEFGSYLSEMARDPDSRESIAIQNFLEFCKRTREDQVHFSVIAHKTLADYALGYRTQADWEKVYGRFLDSEYSLNLAGGDLDIVDMIDAVIISRTDTPERKALWHRVQVDLGPVQDWVLDAQLFPEASESWLQKNLLTGCYPLHPATTFCLPWLAQRAGQANRTAFMFLESSEPGGFQEFVGSARVFSDSDGLNLYTPEKLIAYFGPGASEKPNYRPILLAYEQALAACGTERSAKRVIDLLAVLEIVAQPTLQPRRETLTSLLAATPAEEADVGNIIDALAQERIIRLRPATERYELPRRGTGEVDVYEAIAMVKEQLRQSFNLLENLRDRAGTYLSPVTARLYEEKYAVPRTAARDIVSPRHLANLETYRSRIAGWYLPKRGAYQGDALMLYVVAESETEIEAARVRVSSGTGSDQLLVLIPRQPFVASEAALDLAAIQHLRQLDLKIGEGTVDAEDLDKAEREKEALIDRALKLYMSSDNFVWYHAKNVAADMPANGEEDFISNVMLTAFNKTPIVRDEALAGTSAGRDMQKKYRVQAMQQLLEVDGPIKIMKSTGQANERMLRAALVETEVLQKTQELGKAAEYEVRKIVPDGSALAEVWSYLQVQFTTPEVPVQLSGPISKLIAPPYGLSNQLLELIIAAVLRPIKDQCVILGNHSKVMQSGQTKDYTHVPIVADRIPMLVSDPENYVLLYYEVLPSQRTFLQELISLLDPDGKSTDPGGLWERARNALIAWYTQLPLATRRATELSTAARAVSQLLNDDSNLRDAKRMLSVELPEALGVRISGGWPAQTTLELRNAFQPIYEELQNHIQIRTQMAIEQLCELFGTTGRTRVSLDEATQNWYSGLSEAQRLHQFSGDAGQLIRAINEPGDVTDRFLVRLPQALSTPPYPPYTEWIEATTVRAFTLQVQIAKQQVESWVPPKGPGPISSGDEVQVRTEVAAREIRTILTSTGLSRDTQIRILIELLAEIKQ